MKELDLIEKDFLELLDYENSGLTKNQAKNLLKATIKNLFDCLKSNLQSH